MKKKVLTLLLTIITAAGLVGCGSPKTSDVTVRIGSLKGPTTMGLVNLMKDSETGSAKGKYEFDMEADPSVVLASMASGDLDIALVPANTASVLYNKTDGGITVIDINTLGVLECITGDETITSVSDLAGRTVVTTGQGTTPQYTLEYLLDQNGITDCTLDFKSEASEVAAVLASDPDTVAVLPQPFATACQLQNDQVSSVFKLADEWDALGSGSRMVTGVTVVRDEFLEKNPQAVALFLEEQSASASKAVSDVENTAALIAEYGIIEKAPVAMKALPSCNIVCITGEEMEAALGGYLEVLYQADPKSVGGTLPGDDFWYRAD